MTSRPPRASHHEVISRFAAACEADDRIVAAMLFGSYARGEADEHSDVDLCVVATDEDLVAVLADREALLARLGTPLFFETFGDPRNALFILADGLEGELLCESESGLSGLDIGPFAALVDKRGLLAGAEFPYPKVDPVAESERIERIVRIFWHDLSHLNVALARADLWWAAGQLHVLRDACVNLARVSAGAGAAEGEDIVWKLKRDVPAEDLAALAGTFVPLERGRILRAARELITFFSAAAPRVAQRHGVAYPDELATLMTAKFGAVEEELERFDEAGRT